MAFDPCPPLCNDSAIDIVGVFSCSNNYLVSDITAVEQLPLPGVIIFVHGVNSDGEWYEAAEEGLCQGLNHRLGRGRDFTPVNYGAEITDEGFLNPEMSADTLIREEGTFSPVIRFRWGYKASGEELQKYGKGIYLNEENYWGGGPFANGCSALADLWKDGLSDGLFLWNTIQHMNPFPERQVFSCPPRAYFVLAAYRLAKLVEAIRQQQADVPISIVCHSQGTMVAMAAAFLGQRLPAVSGVPCVADNYVICNSPYSLAESNFSENWIGGNLRAADGSSGRLTLAARLETLKNFFAIIRQRASLAALQTDERVDTVMGDAMRGFSAARDREQYGIAGSARGGKKSSYGRVTIYCNPHDIVVSSIAIQGIGWRGLSGTLAPEAKSADGGELLATNAEGVCVQRVFAQGFEVGKQGSYHYWNDHWRRPEAGGNDFWFPSQKYASYSIRQGNEANPNAFAVILNIAFAPIFLFFTSVFKQPTNASPHENWKIEVNAPALPPFLPCSRRLDRDSETFDEGYDPPGESRQAGKQRAAGDDFLGDREIPRGGLQDQLGKTETARVDSAKGTAADEARLRYEQRGAIRAKAVRDGISPAGQTVQQETRNATPDASYMSWRSARIEEMMKNQVGTFATDHSTIMTNPMHAEKALAYDVAVGECRIKPAALRKFRVAADWRLLKALEGDVSAKVFKPYFSNAIIRGVSTAQWVRLSDCEARLPDLIIDKRENIPQFGHPMSGELAHG